MCRPGLLSQERAAHAETKRKLNSLRRQLYRARKKVREFEDSERQERAYQSICEAERLERHPDARSESK